MNYLKIKLKIIYKKGLEIGICYYFCTRLAKQMWQTFRSKQSSLNKTSKIFQIKFEVLKNRVSLHSRFGGDKKESSLQIENIM